MDETVIKRESSKGCGGRRHGFKKKGKIQQKARIIHSG